MVYGTLVSQAGRQREGEARAGVLEDFFEGTHLHDHYVGRLDDGHGRGGGGAPGASGVRPGTRGPEPGH